MIIGCLAIGDVSLALLNFRLQGLKSPCENSNLGAAALTSGVHLLDSKHGHPKAWRYKSLVSRVLTRTLKPPLA
jgi:hypothetical protein